LKKKTSTKVKGYQSKNGPIYTEAGMQRDNFLTDQQLEADFLEADFSCNIHLILNQLSPISFDTETSS